MRQHNDLNAKLSNSQLNKSKFAIKTKTEVFLILLLLLLLLLNMIGYSDSETNFSHKLLLTNRQVANLCKVFLTNHRLILSYQKLNYLR